MSRAVPPLPLYAFWRGQGHLYLFFTFGGFLNGVLLGIITEQNVCVPLGNTQDEGIRL
jgi:hypothetical protein